MHKDIIEGWECVEIRRRHQDSGHEHWIVCPCAEAARIRSDSEARQTITSATYRAANAR